MPIHLPTQTTSSQLSVEELEAEAKKPPEFEDVMATIMGTPRTGPAQSRILYLQSELHLRGQLTFRVEAYELSIAAQALNLQGSSNGEVTLVVEPTRTIIIKPYAKVLLWYCLPACAIMPDGVARQVVKLRSDMFFGFARLINKAGRASCRGLVYTLHYEGDHLSQEEGSDQFNMLACLHTGPDKLVDFVDRAMASPKQPAAPATLATGIGFASPFTSARDPRCTTVNIWNGAACARSPIAAVSLSDQLLTGLSMRLDAKACKAIKAGLGRLHHGLTGHCIVNNLQVFADDIMGMAFTALPSDSWSLTANAKAELLAEVEIDPEFLERAIAFLAVGHTRAEDALGVHLDPESSRIKLSLIALKNGGHTSVTLESATYPDSPKPVFLPLAFPDVQEAIFAHKDSVASDGAKHRSLVTLRILANPRTHEPAGAFFITARTGGTAMVALNKKILEK